MTDPRIAAIDDLLRRYPIDSHGWCGLIVKGSVTWGARVTDILAAADAVDPRGTQLAELKARLAAVYAITDTVATGQPANPNTGDRDVSWLALVEALCDDLPRGAAGVPEQAEPPTAPCEGFAYIGQPFTSCDECGYPIGDHEGARAAIPGADPFNGDWQLNRFTADERQRFIDRYGSRLSPVVPPTPETQQ